MDRGAENYRRYLDGDDGGFVDIIRDYRDGLTLCLFNCTGSISTAEELMEETFFKLMTRKPRFKGKSSFKTWLYAVGRNLAIDYLRKSAKNAELPDDLAEEESVERAYLKEERKLIVHRALGRLNPDYRQVLYLVYFEGITNSDAAVVMKKNKRQIENLLCRARQALRKELEKEGFTYEGL